MTGNPPPRHLNYDGREFRSIAPATSYGSDGPTGHYHQLRDLVWAEFAGGEVRMGRLVGRCSPDGTLSAGYVQVLIDGRTIAGEVISWPTVLADGRIRLRERWQRSDGTSGVSWIEEMTSLQDRNGARNAETNRTSHGR